jgi:hypothetical protein
VTAPARNTPRSSATSASASATATSPVIDRPLALECRDANRHRVRFANYCVQVLSNLNEHALSIGWIDTSPSRRARASRRRSTRDRQAEIFNRQGIHLDRGTLGNWVGRACFHLMPVIGHMRGHLRGADRIFVDETRAPVLDPVRKATKSGFFWAVVSHDRGHGGAGPPIVLFH